MKPVRSLHDGCAILSKHDSDFQDIFSRTDDSSSAVSQTSATFDRSRHFRAARHFITRDIFARRGI
jgi:hypothetical protein